MESRSVGHKEWIKWPWKYTSQISCCGSCNWQWPQPLHLQIYCCVHTEATRPVSQWLHTVGYKSRSVSEKCKNSSVGNFDLKTPHQPGQNFLGILLNSKTMSILLSPSLRIRPALWLDSSFYLLLLLSPPSCKGIFPPKSLTCLLLSWCQILGGPELTHYPLSYSLFSFFSCQCDFSKIYFHSLVKSSSVLSWTY